MASLKATVNQNFLLHNLLACPFSKAPKREKRAKEQIYASIARRLYTYTPAFPQIKYTFYRPYFMENIVFLSHNPSQEKGGPKFSSLMTHLSTSICRLANPQKAKKCEILNLKLEKAVKNG